MLAGVLTVSSFAAAPTKGALCEGTLYASGTAAITKVVRLKVAASGKTARVSWLCGVGRAPSTLQFAIRADRTFKAHSKHGDTHRLVVRRPVHPVTQQASPREGDRCRQPRGAAAG